MGYILAHQTKRLPHLQGTRANNALLLKGAVELLPKRTCHTKHPIMAGQALKITEERLTDAEQLHKPNGNIEREQAHFGRQRGIADKEARHKYKQRCE